MTSDSWVACGTVTCRALVDSAVRSRCSAGHVGMKRRMGVALMTVSATPPPRSPAAAAWLAEVCQLVASAATR